jgi:hypothetical protein
VFLSTIERLPEMLLDGYLPIDLIISSEKGCVTWANFADIQLVEPFFHDTVMKIEASEPGLEKVKTDLAQVMVSGRSLPPVVPKGLVFHISRCGSTLISNALRIAQRTIVIAEAQPLAAVFLPRMQSTPMQGEYGTELRRMVLQSLANIYGSHSGSRPGRLIIKFASWNLLGIPLIRSLWPTVPCVIAIRDPVEVIVSHLATAAGWKALKGQATVACKIFGFTLADRTVLDMPIEEYYARILGRLYRAAAAAIDQNCRVCDYNDIGPQRLAKISEFFQTEVPEKGALERVLSLHAKDPTSTRLFNDDREVKQRSATDAVRTSVNRWARASFEELRALQMW